MLKITSRNAISGLALVAAAAGPFLFAGSAHAAQQSEWIMITPGLYANEAIIAQCNDYALRYGGRGGDGQHLREGQWSSCVQRLSRDTGGPAGLTTRSVRGTYP